MRPVGLAALLVAAVVPSLALAQKIDCSKLQRTSDHSYVATKYTEFVAPCPNVDVVARVKQCIYHINSGREIDESNKIAYPAYSAIANKCH
jgi:hypothetical protein